MTTTATRRWSTFLCNAALSSVLLHAPNAQATAFVDVCQAVTAVGSTAELDRTEATGDSVLQHVGCVTFPARAEQGPFTWYRASLVLVATVVPGTGAADLEVAIGDGDVILASLYGDGEAMVVTSPTIGEPFSPIRKQTPGDDPTTVRIEISNYLQQASLDHEQADVGLRFTEYGLDVVSVALERGTIEVSEQPPYPVAVAVGAAADSGVELIVSLRDPSAFAGALSLLAEPASSDRSSAEIVRHDVPTDTAYAHEYLLRPDCESSPCTLDVTAAVGADSVTVRLNARSGTGRFNPGTIALLVFGTVCLGVAVWVWPARPKPHRSKPRSPQPRVPPPGETRQA